MPATTLHITDPVFTGTPANGYGPIDRFFLHLIRDERDLPFIHLCLRISLTIVPIAVLLYWPGMFRWWIAALYLALNWSLFMGRYILMLHCTSHRALYKSEYGWMNKLIPWFFGPFFGETPETYYAHHMGMHHPENNLDEDLSTTIHYQRDSFRGFMHYFLRFFFFGPFDLTSYFSRKNRPKLRSNFIVGELSWYVFVIVLSLFNWKATLAVFVIPMVFTRFMMMAGNWGQHAFVDRNDPGNCYRNSITCINSGYNKACFNDGYHIIHHIKPNMHYTDMPVEFQQNRDTYARERAIVFEGLDFFLVWFLLMTKNYRKLARHFVHLDDTYKNDDQVIAFLKERVKRF